MTTKARREELKVYFTGANDKKVNALYDLLEGEFKERPFTLSEDQLNILEERRGDYQSGEATPKPWQEAHDKITNEKNNI